MAAVQPTYNCSLLTLICSGPAVNQAFIASRKALNSDMSKLGFVGVSSTFDWKTKDPGQLLKAVARGILGNVENAFVQSFTSGSLTVEVVTTDKEAAEALLDMYESKEMLRNLNAAIEDYSSKVDKDLGRFDCVSLINYNERNIAKKEVDEVKRRAYSCFQMTPKSSKVPPQPVWVSPSEIDLERDDRVVIGWGGFGSVLRCYYKKVGRCAVKCVRATSITDDVKTAAQRFEKEAGIFLMADHTNIVRVYGITSWVGSFGIIMEYMERRNLANLIQSASSKDYQIPFDLLVRILLQVANGVAFLHKIGEDKQIVHGDLKPSNIVLDNNFTAKVTDFGGATLRTYTGTNEGGRVAENVEHTPVYTAPERLVHLEYAATKASDVYSYGLIVYECLSDRVPYGGKFPNKEILIILLKNTNEIERPNYERIDNKKRIFHGNTLLHLLFLEKWMKSCWQYNKDDRPKMISVRDKFQQHFDKVGREEILHSVAEISKLQPNAQVSEGTTEFIHINRLKPPHFQPSDVQTGTSSCLPCGRKRSSEERVASHNEKMPRFFTDEPSTSQAAPENKIKSLIRKVENALTADAKVLEAATRELYNALKREESRSSDDNALLVRELNDLCGKMIMQKESPAYHQLVYHALDMCSGIADENDQKNYYESFLEKL